MAVKRTLIEAVPSVLDSKVVRWTFTMKYEQGTEGQADYYANDKRITMEASETIGERTITNFTPKAEADWTKKELEDLCPTAEWDEIFASQYDSVISNPSKDPVPDNDYVIPS